MIGIDRFVLGGGPQRVAPFRQAVRAGDLLFVTGQTPTDPADSTRCVGADAAARTRQVIGNLKSVLGGCGARWKRTAMPRIHLREFHGDHAAVNAVWEAAFPPGGVPARTAVGVSGLALGALVEVEFVAVPQTMLRSPGLAQMAWPLPIHGIARFRRLRPNASRSSRLRKFDFSAATSATLVLQSPSARQKGSNDDTARFSCVLRCAPDEEFPQPASAPPTPRPGRG